MKESISNHGTFIVISDFNYGKWSIAEKISSYLDEYDIIYLLGDATNPKNEGTLSGKEGIQLLIEIMELTKKYPRRIVYMPGNHDEMLYDYAIHSDTNIGHLMEDSLNENDGVETIRSISELMMTNQQVFNELMIWLGSLPLQRTHVYDNQKYALAHAFFNKNIYEENPNFSLQDLYASHGEYYDISSIYSQILWYKKGQSYSPADVPVDFIEIIGHAPINYREEQNLDLANSEGRMTKVICVGDGLAYQNNEMLENIDENESKAETNFYNSSSQPKIYSEYEHSLFLKAVEATIKKYGIEQLKWILINCIFSDDDKWYMPFTRPERFYIENIEIEKIKKMICDYSPKGEKDQDSIIENFIKAVSKMFIKRETPITATEEPLDITKEMLKILDEVATPQEQEIDITFEGKTYTFREYIIKIMPSLCTAGRMTKDGLLIRLSGKWINFRDCIERAILEYKRVNEEIQQSLTKDERQTDKITSKLIQILNKIATPQEQEEVMIFGGNEYKLKDYITEIIPHKFELDLEQERLLINIGEWTDFETYLKKIILGYRREKAIELVSKSKHYSEVQRRDLIDEISGGLVTSGNHKIL